MQGGAKRFSGSLETPVPEHVELSEMEASDWLLDLFTHFCRVDSPLIIQSWRVTPPREFAVVKQQFCSADADTNNRLEKSRAPQL